MENPYRLLLLSILPIVSLACESTTACMEVSPDSNSCPSRKDVDKKQLDTGLCGSRVVRVTGEGTLVPWHFDEDETDTGTGAPQPLACCYPVRATENDCIAGRPFLVEDAQVIAEARRGGAPDWMASIRALDLRGLTDFDKAVLARVWTDRALEEHGAIAAFARVAMQLMGAGAPAELVDDSLAAGNDEVRHASLCFALASAYAGTTIGPKPFPLERAIELECDLVGLAVAAAQEGCIGETLSAALLYELSTIAEESTVRSVLRSIAEDENRHAQLAWRTVRWAISVGGREVRDAVAAVFDVADRSGVTVATGFSDDDRPALRRHGVLGAEASSGIVQRGLRELVLPCGQLLVGKPVPMAGFAVAMA